MLAKFILWQYQKIYRYDRWMRQHFSFNGHLLIVLMVAAAVFGVDTKHSNTYQLFVLLLLVLIFSRLSSRFNRLKLHLTRQLPRYGTVGEQLTYTVVLTPQNAKSYDRLTLIEQLSEIEPTPAQLQQFSGSKKSTWRSFLPSFKHWLAYLTYQRGGVIAPLLLPCLQGKPLTVKISFIPTRRGQIYFATCHIAQPDLFGLYQQLITFTQPQRCLILPKRYPMRALLLRGKHKYQAGGVSLASSVGNSLEFMALRDYQHGDPLNKIHWKSFAKHGQLVVKEYQDEYFVRRALLLDTFAEAGEGDLFEAAVSVAASLAMNERQQEALLDLMFAGDKTYCFTVGRGVDQLPHLQEILAQVQANPVDTFVSLQEAVLARLEQCSSFVCVLLRWDAQRQALMQTLAAQQLPVAVFLLNDGQLTAAQCQNKPEFFYLLNYQQLAKDLAAV
jgi:hypothetical protein